MRLEEKSYFSPRVSTEYMDVTMPFTFDQYNYCAHNCLYCFSFIQRGDNPSVKTDEHGFMSSIRGINHQKVKKMFLGKYPNNPHYKAFIKRKFVLHWGGLSDPFCPLENKFGVGYKMLKLFADIDYPVIFSTKGNLMLQGKYLDILKSKSVRNQHNFSFQFSITVNDDKLSKKLERGVPSTSERIEAVKRLADLGYWVTFRLSPFLIGASEIDLDSFVKRLADAGVRDISTRFMCLQCKASPCFMERFDAISGLVKYDMVDYFKALSPTERGSYLRLNRSIKAKYFKKLVLAAKKYGLRLTSYDPDFRDFVLPNNKMTMTDYNPKLGQRSKIALSHHLKVLRKRYWQSGRKDQYLTWQDIINSESFNWMKDFNYYQESLRRFKTRYDMKNITVQTEYHSTWNNLRSSKNPYTYYYGKLVPVRTDANGDIVYKYNPSEYEIQWIKEGITEY